MDRLTGRIKRAELKAILSALNGSDVLFVVDNDRAKKSAIRDLVDIITSMHLLGDIILKSTNDLISFNFGGSIEVIEFRLVENFILGVRFDLSVIVINMTSIAPNDIHKISAISKEIYIA